MIALIAILMIQSRLVAGTVAILGTVALMVMIRDRLRVAYLATQFEPIYVWRPALTGGLCPLCAGRASKCRHDRLDALEVHAGRQYRIE